MHSLKISFFLPVVFIFLWNCTHRATTTATQPTAYSEDLSGLRPDVKEYESPEPFSVNPADTVIKEPEHDVTARVNVILDSMALLNRQTQFSQLTILVYNGNSREAAEQARLDIFRILPGSKPTLEFVAPTYRVKLGNYFNELKAYQTLQKLKDHFPNAIIVPEPVHFR